MTDPARSFTFLVNPDSGGGAAPAAAIAVARLLRDAGAAVELSYSRGAHAMGSFVTEAISRGDVVVSVGGDGTLSSLAGLTASAGGTLALVPAGRGNDFARMLGLPDAPADVARVLLTTPVRHVDLISLTLPGGTPRTVVGSVYCGVDARAGEIVDRAHRLPRPLQYPYAAIRALATYRPGRFRLSVDGDEQEYAAATVVVANSAYYGSGMRIAPAAAVQDGVLDVVVIAAASRPALMRALTKIYDGAHVGLPAVTVTSGRRIELRADADPSIPVGGDGERLGVLPALAGSPAIVEVRPGALAVIA